MDESTSIHSLLRAAATDASHARALRSALVARPLFDPKSPEHIVATAIKTLLGDGDDMRIDPALVIQMLGSKCPWWMRAASDADLSGFRASLRSEIAQYDTRVLKKSYDMIVRDLASIGEITEESRSLMVGQLLAPTPTQTINGRDAHYRAVSRRPSLNGMLVNTGFPTFDMLMPWDFDQPVATPGNRFPGGMSGGDLVVIAAETGHGKTQFSLELAARSVYLYNKLHHTHRSFLYFSAEQAAEKIAAKGGFRHPGSYWYRLYEESGSNAYFFDAQDYGQGCLSALTSVILDHVRGIVFQGRDEGKSTTQIRAELPLMIVIDYAKLFAASGVALVTSIEALSRDTKAQICQGQAFKGTRLAELESYMPTVVLPTQVLRPKTGKDRGDWRPSIDDLADCRSIRDNCDLLLMLYREGDQGEITIPKARNGVLEVNHPVSMYVRQGRWFQSVKEANEFAGPPLPFYEQMAATARRERQERRRPSASAA